MLEDQHLKNFYELYVNDAAYAGLMVGIVRTAQYNDNHFGSTYTLCK